MAGYDDFRKKSPEEAEQARIDLEQRKAEQFSKLKDFLKDKFAPLQEYAESSATKYPASAAPFEALGAIGKTVDNFTGRPIRRFLYEGMTGEEKEDPSGSDLVQTFLNKEQEKTGIPFTPEGMSESPISKPLGMMVEAGSDLTNLIPVMGVLKNSPKLAQELKALGEAGELDIGAMKRLASLMGKNPSQVDVLQAAGLKEPKTLVDYVLNRETEKEILDFIARERHGIFHDMPLQEVLDKMHKIYEPQLPPGTGTTMVVNPDLPKEGASGVVRHKGGQYAYHPKSIEIDPNSKSPAAVFEHEKIGHEVDRLTNPFTFYQPELFPDPLEQMAEAFAVGDNSRLTSIPKFLANHGFQSKYRVAEILGVDLDTAGEILKSTGLNRYISDKDQAAKAGEMLLDILAEKGINVPTFSNIGKAGHHWRHPRNFELERSLELLNPDLPVVGPSLENNLKIIKDVDAIGPQDLRSAYQLYKEKKFPNIEQLLEERNKFQLFPIDPKTGKYIR